MKKSILLITNVLFLVFCLTACDDLSQEARSKYISLAFDAQGGTQINEVILKKHPWWFNTLYLTIKDPDITKEEFKDGRIDPKKIENELLPNGVQRIHYDWVTFYIANDLKSIEVKVEKNNTHKPRGIEFVTYGYRESAVDFFVYQEA